MRRKDIINLAVLRMQEWWNRQTRRLQVPVVAIPCGFKSHLLHYGEGMTQVMPFFVYVQRKKAAKAGFQRKGGKDAIQGK